MYMELKLQDAFLFYKIGKLIVNKLFLYWHTWASEWPMYVHMSVVWEVKAVLRTTWTHIDLIISDFGHV